MDDVFRITGLTSLAHIIQLALVNNAIFLCTARLFGLGFARMMAMIGRQPIVTIIASRATRLP